MYILKYNELPFDAPESRWVFNLIGKHLDITPGASAAIGPELGTLLAIVHQQVRLRNGLDSLQVFRNNKPSADDLYVIEKADVIAMVMASDYGNEMKQFIHNIR